MWSFLARLRERKLAPWAIAYLAGAWLILQVLDRLAQPFAGPALVQEIARLLTASSGLGVHTLRVDPRWDPIRNDPRIPALLVKYADPQPVD